MIASRIFLIGFMGSGKSTYGKKLAHHLAYQFIDLDQLIESSEAKSIPEIFAEIGEENFRILESEYLKKHFIPENTVIACGGGTPCYYDNMDTINQLGKSIYLYANAKTLAKRLYSGKSNRPLIKDLSNKELENFIKQKLADREAYYERAHIVVDAIHFQVANIMEILEKS